MPKALKKEINFSFYKNLRVNIDCFLLV